MITYIKNKNIQTFKSFYFYDFLSFLLLTGVQPVFLFSFSRPSFSLDIYLSQNVGFLKVYFSEYVLLNLSFSFFPTTFVVFFFLSRGGLMILILGLIQLFIVNLYTFFSSPSCSTYYLFTCTFSSIIYFPFSFSSSSSISQISNYFFSLPDFFMSFMISASSIFFLISGSSYGSIFFFIFLLKSLLSLGIMRLWALESLIISSCIFVLDFQFSFFSYLFLQANNFCFYLFISFSILSCHCTLFAVFYMMTSSSKKSLFKLFYLLEFFKASFLEVLRYVFVINSSSQSTKGPPQLRLSFCS